MKTLAISFSLMILVAACASRRSEALAGRTFTSSDPQVLNGQVKYNLYCQKCHPGGEAGLGPALNSNPAPGFVKRFQIRHGLGVMPSFKRDEIARKDVRDIVKYMKALKRFK
jgi:mono/diheme cytochrome c family protein